MCVPHFVCVLACSLGLLYGFESSLHRRTFTKLVSDFAQLSDILVNPLKGLTMKFSKFVCHVEL